MSVLNSMTVVTGVLRYDDLGYLALVHDQSGDEPAPTLFLEWDAGTLRRPSLDAVPWTAVGATCVTEPQSQGMFLGLGGEVYCIGGGDTHLESILSDDPEGLGGVGPLRAVAAVDGHAVAVGMCRQAYLRSGRDRWHRIDADVRTDDHSASFEAVAGFTADNVFAAGRHGEIWHFDGVGWTCEANGSSILTGLLCAANGVVYACGLAGGAAAH